MELPENEKLTPEEKAFLLKHIEKNERNNSSWAWNRWLNVFGCVFLFVFGMFCFYQFYLTSTAGSIFTEAVILSPGTPISVGTLNTQAQMNFIRSTQNAYMFFMCFMSILGGTSILARTLIEWNRHHRERVMNKIFRRFLRENSSADEK